MMITVHIHRHFSFHRRQHCLQKEFSTHPYRHRLFSFPRMSATLLSIGKQIIIYCGTPIFIAGIIGVLLNTVVFLSLRTFRQNSCAFYLTIMSIANIGPIFLGLLSRIMIALLGFDGTERSLFYCKARLYIVHVCIGTSLTCMCLSTIDQYLATCSRPHWQHFCHIKQARRIIFCSTIFWSLHGIPYLVFLIHVKSSMTNIVSCTTTNYIFGQYRIYVVLLVLIGYLPAAIAVFFGSMAYYNVRHIAHRTIPIVRHELDKQLTTMVLVQIIVNIPALVSYTTVSAVTTNPNLFSDSVSQAGVQFALNICHTFYYVTFSVRNWRKSIEFHSFVYLLLESILYLCICFGTFSSTINLCSISTMETPTYCYQSNITDDTMKRACQYN